MKYILVFTALFLFGFGSCHGQEKINTIKLEVFKKRFGSKKLNTKNFKNGSEQDRAKMAYDLINSKKYIGMHRSDIQKELGEPTGYFRSETFLTYLVYVRREGPLEALQILFVPDRKGVIKQVLIHNQADIVE